MAKAGDKIKAGAAKIAEKILPKSIKEAAKKNAMEVGMGGATSDDPATRAALEKAKQDAMNASASDIINAAGGYDKAAEAGRKGELSKLGLGKDVSERIVDAQTEAGQNQTSEQAEEARKARVASTGEEDVSRRAAYQAARNTGANRAASSAIGSSIDTRGLQSNVGSALRNASTSTQADYLNKLGYVEGLESNAQNMRAGSFLNTLGSIFQGAATGTKTGMSLGGGF